MIDTNTGPLKPNLNVKEGPGTVPVFYSFGLDTNTPKSGRGSSFASFNALPKLEELARDQGVSPVNNFDDLIGDFWPEEENVDDFLAARERWRREAHNSDT